MCSGVYLRSDFVIRAAFLSSGTIPCESASQPFFYLLWHRFWNLGQDIVFVVVKQPESGSGISW